MKTTKLLPVYVLYDHPKDCPTYFIVRIHWAGSDGVHADSKSYGFKELWKARAWLEQQGLFKLERHPNDDPVIIETWV